MPQQNFYLRDLDSVGAVGVAAPIDFEESSFCTLNFHTKIPLSIVFGAYLKICTHSFEILTKSLFTMTSWKNINWRRGSVAATGEKAPSSWKASLKLRLESTYFSTVCKNEFKWMCLPTDRTIKLWEHHNRTTFNTYTWNPKM